MYRKSGCIVKKKTFLQGKTSKTRVSIEENGIMYRKSGCIIKKHRFYKVRLKFYIETRLSIKENSIYVSILLVKKTRFYKERLKFYIENEVFYRRK